MSDSRPVLLVRFRRGVVGETKRVCHVVPAPERDDMPEFMVAYCGTRIGPSEAELLPEPAGMPCELCLAHAPVAPPFGALDPSTRASRDCPSLELMRHVLHGLLKT